MPRPRKYETQAQRQAAYQARKDARIEESVKLAETAREIARVAAARGFIELLSENDLAAAKKVLSLLEQIELPREAEKSHVS